MVRAAEAVGIDDVHCRVGMTDIVLTAGRGQMFTRVAEVPRPTVDADRMTALKRLTARLQPGTTRPTCRASCARSSGCRGATRSDARAGGRAGVRPSRC
jgi:hypothetical protein